MISLPNTMNSSENLTTQSLRLLAEGFFTQFADKVYQDERFTELMMEISTEFVQENIPIVEEMYQVELSMMLMEKIKISSY